MGETEATFGRVKSDWVLVDVGNTHVKICLAFDGCLGEVRLVPTSGRSRRFFDCVAGGMTRTAVCSVNPGALEDVKVEAASVGLELKFVLISDGGVFRSGLVSTDVTTPETTGVDRVLACLGASQEARGRSIIVVDCGTATTVNVMTADQCFRGGMIAPGRGLLSWSLGRGTAALPDVTPGPALRQIGKSTQEAMNAGVTAAFIGGVRDCVETARKAFPNSQVFLTGGDAELASEAFPEFERLEWLTLKGLHWYASRLSASL